MYIENNSLEHSLLSETNNHETEIKVNSSAQGNSISNSSLPENLNTIISVHTNAQPQIQFSPSWKVYVGGGFAVLAAGVFIGVYTGQVGPAFITAFGGAALIGYGLEKRRETPTTVSI